MIPRSTINADKTRRLRHAGGGAVLKSALFCAAVLLAPFCPAHGTPPDRPSLTIYQGQGVSSNLLDLFPDLVRGDLRRDDTYFTGLGYFHPVRTPQVMQRVFDFLRIPNTGTGFEAIVVKHYGEQDNLETNLAYTLRFGEIKVCQLTMRFGAGLGLSYAFGTPTYEDGPKDDPDKRYHLQNYNAYEIEWGLASFPRIGIVTRIHHRSGAYGLIAPRHVGSNFITLGLRYSF